MNALCTWSANRPVKINLNTPEAGPSPDNSRLIFAGVCFWPSLHVCFSLVMHRAVLCSRERDRKRSPVSCLTRQAEGAWSKKGIWCQAPAFKKLIFRYKIQRSNAYPYREHCKHYRHRCRRPLSFRHFLTRRGKDKERLFELWCLLMCLSHSFNLWQNIL